MLKASAAKILSARFNIHVILNGCGIRPITQHFVCYILMNTKTCNSRNYERNNTISLSKPLLPVFVIKKKLTVSCSSSKTSYMWKYCQHNASFLYQAKQFRSLGNPFYTVNWNLHSVFILYIYDILMTFCFLPSDCMNIYDNGIIQFYRFKGSYWV